MNIPQWTRKESIPAVSGNAMADPEAMSKPWQALAIAGKQVGDKYLDLSIKMQSKIDATETLKAIDDFRNEQRNYINGQLNIVGKNVIDVSDLTQNEADKGKDLTTRATEWHKIMADTYANNLSNDNQRDLFYKLASNEIDSGINKVALHQAEQTRQYFTDQINYSIDTAIKDIQENPSEDTVNRAKLKVATVVQAIYPGQNVDDYKLHALNRIDTATAAIREQAKITGVYDELITQYTNQQTQEIDVNAAIDTLMKPNNYKNLTIEEKNKLSMVIYSEWSRKKQFLDEKQKETESNLLSDWSGLKRTGKSRMAWYQKIEGLARNGEVSKEFQAGAISLLKQDIEEAKRGPETNPVSYAILHERVMRGDVSIGEIMKANSISNDRKNSLIDKFYSKVESATHEAERQAKDYVKSQLISTGPLGTPLPAEYERLYKAYEGIDKYADEAKKAGKPWTINEYMKYAEDLANHYRPSMNSKIRDMQQTFTAQSITQPTSKKNEIQKRKPNENIDDYLKRTGMK